MNIQEFKFRITTQDRNPEGEENQFIYYVNALSNYDAWLKCVAEVDKALLFNETLYKIELMEVTTNG